MQANGAAVVPDCAVASQVLQLLLGSLTYCRRYTELGDSYVRQFAGKLHNICITEAQLKLR